MKFVKTLSAVTSCNVAHKELITPKILVDILAGKRELEPWQSHLDVFFNEVPEDIVRGVMEENALSIKELSKAFSSLPPVYQGKKFREFLNEYASLGNTI